MRCVVLTWLNFILLVSVSRFDRPVHCWSVECIAVEGNGASRPETSIESYRGGPRVDTPDPERNTGVHGVRTRFQRALLVGQERWFERAMDVTDKR